VEPPRLVQYKTPDGIKGFLHSAAKEAMQQDIERAVEQLESERLEDEAQ